MPLRRVQTVIYQMVPYDLMEQLPYPILTGRLWEQATITV